MRGDAGVDPGEAGAGRRLLLGEGLGLRHGLVVDVAEGDVATLGGQLADELGAYDEDRVGRLGEDVSGAQWGLNNIEGYADISEYRVRMFENGGRGIGQKGKDNGVLVVIVPPERKMRIEVGYGLEGRLTDVHASRIIRDVMAPRFKANDFDRGTEEGVGAILARLKGEAGEVTGGDEPSARGVPLPGP